MKQIKLICALLLLACTTASSQKKEADEKYLLYDYNKSIPLYTKYLKDHSSDDDALHKLADSYKITNRIQEGIQTYQQLVGLNKANANDYFELVRLLQIAQHIDEAKTYAKTFSTLEPGNRANVLQESLMNFDKYMATADKFRVENKTSQYNFSVHSAKLYQNSIVVTAESKKNDINKCTGGHYTDLFITDKSFNNLNTFASNIMSDLDDCVPSFSNNGNTMYYTSVNEQRAKSGNVNTRNMHILSSELKGDNWSKSIELPFNSNAFSSAHATMHSNGTMMVFSSDRPGGKGGMDLYYTKLIGGSWSEPVNISTINTFGNEVFPVFNGDDLVFSTNGLPGLGGLDLFKSRYDGGTSFGTPENIKAPFNSSYDDFSLVSQDDFQTGYFSSNRNGNPQKDDVYSFSKNGVTPVVQTPVVKAGSKGLKITVKDKYTSTPLPYVSVSVKDKNGSEIQKGLSDENGLVVIDEIDCDEYKIQGVLNDVTTSIAKVTKSDCEGSSPYIEKEILHNDPRFTLRGIVKDASTNKPLEGVKVTLKNETNGSTKVITTKPDGKFFFQLEQKSNFSVNGEKPKWLSSERADVTTEGLDRSTELYVDLSLKMYEPTANAVIRLKNIFYDLNKSDIKPQSEAALNGLVKLMNDYPDMKIELASHTDCRNTDSYNMSLSQRRSESATAYLISKGIAASRIIAKGYGETRLINRCKDGVTCSEEEHQENRRTEFTILSCSSCPK